MPSGKRNVHSDNNNNLRTGMSLYMHQWDLIKHFTISNVEIFLCVRAVTASPYHQLHENRIHERGARVNENMKIQHKVLAVLYRYGSGKDSETCHAALRQNIKAIQRGFLTCALWEIPRCSVEIT